MKPGLHFILFIILNPLLLTAQITSPVVRARFGVDADLRANYFNGLVQAGNDDWYNFNPADTTGKFVIDTTGAASILAGYLTDAAPWPKRMASFYRGMSRPAFSVINNRLWLDAVFVRDYHGTDTTVFSVGSKNGQSPAVWTPTIQSIPDKNDILDMYVHVRRAGPNSTDSLWMFGGISMDNVTGNRYFDFEMYQTDIYYDRVTQKFYGYGPDAGHTSWKFDAAGNVTKPGDIIFTGEFQSSTLTNIEARIWVKKTDWQTVTPAAFNWNGLFDGDGAGATYGYASISPKTAGAFYTGLGSNNNTWAGPFGLVLQDNSLAYSNPGPASTTNSKYIADQFIEFSVNLTKLGLDPVTLLGGDICGSPFNRIVVKTRASAAFTAALKDFVAPTDLFLAPRADAEAEFPVFCTDTSYTDIYVVNPSSSATYIWSTPNGNITTNPPIGTTIRVDEPGTYIVTQYLNILCAPYATDTVVIGFNDSTCILLQNQLLNFEGIIKNGSAEISWSVLNNQSMKYFDLERSFDGVTFSFIGRIVNNRLEEPEVSYFSSDPLTGISSETIYYRLLITDVYGKRTYSKIIQLKSIAKNKKKVTVTPNPARNWIQVNISSAINSDVKIYLFDYAGKKVYSRNTFIEKGNNPIVITDIAKFDPGIYQVMIKVGSEIYFEKIVIIK